MERPRTTARWRAAGVFGLLALLPCAVFSRALIPGQTFMSGDIPLVYLPMRSLLRQIGLSGEFTLWNPYIFSGQPLLANVNAAMLYPPNALHYFLPLDRAVSLFALLHFALAGIFMYVLLRDHEYAPLPSFAGAVAFSLSGFMVVNVARPPFQGVYVWLPLSLLVARRWARDPRPLWIGVQALLFCVQTLAGNPQISAYVTTFYFLYVLVVLGPRTFVRMGVVAPVLGVALAAVQVVPFLELVSTSPRARIQDTLFCVQPGPWRMADLPGVFVPEVHPQVERMTSESFYLGALPCLLGLLALVNRERRRESAWLLGMGLLFFLMALGESGPFRTVLPNLPVYNKMRLPMRMLCVPGFVLALVLPAAVEWVSTRRRGLAVVVVCALVAELAWMAARHSWIESIQPFDGPPPRSFVKDDPPRPRFVALPGTEYDYANRGMQWQVSDILGIESVATYEYMRYLLWNEDGHAPDEAELAQAIWDAHFLRMKNVGSPMIRLLHVGHVIELEGTYSSVRHVENPLPYAFVAPTSRVMPAEQQLAALSSPDFRPQDVALVEEEPPLVPQLPSRAPDETTVTSWRADEIRLRVSTRQGGILVISEMYFPGWEARVDGAPAAILRTDTILRGVPVGAGAHDVVLTYRPQSVRRGLLCSAACGVVVGLLLLSGLRKRPA